MQEDPYRDGGADDLDELARAFEARGYAPEGAELDAHAGHDHGHAAHGRPREFEYRGHRVEIVTHYVITIDGERWEQPLEVHHNGTVSYHGLPQYAVPSAVDLVRAVIDTSYEAPAEVRDAVRAAVDEEGEG